MPRPVFMDLYFTLIEPDRRQPGFRATLKLLGVTADQLHTASHASFEDRMNGRLRTPEEVVDHLLERLDRPVVAEERKQLIAHRWQFFHSTQLYPDVLPTLAALRARGHPLALVTNCSAETTTVLERLGLNQFFTVQALSCAVGVSKPDPAIYRYALEQLGCAPAEVVYVGDGDTHELDGAASLGMTTVLLSRPGGPQRDVPADYTISRLDELLELLDEVSP